MQFFPLIRLLSGTIAIIFLCFSGFSTATQYKKKTLVAHRGASAYAPEHTLASYRLALAQGADFVEQDLQITKDGVLVCLHDVTLERTTNVAAIFPTRYKLSGAAKHWYVADFTLQEIKQLDAGSWFDKKFAGASVPTFAEAVAVVRGKAGLFPETKASEAYDQQGFDMARLLLDELKKQKLPDKKTPVIIQSFNPASLQKMAFELQTKIPLVLLIDVKMKEQWLSPAGLQNARKFAAGIGPAKILLDGKPELVALAHNLGLSVTPYTFNEKTKGRFADTRAEMDYFLRTLNVDALFTDHPDQFPHQ